MKYLVRKWSSAELKIAFMHEAVTVQTKWGCRNC